mmetsp:Transcript_2684/g.3658  ORF Transcript_2684/g.3658 Transcript_2684/m.3658 type:complete len:212 (-) Transcript_2684:122-757(-)
MNRVLIVGIIALVHPNDALSPSQIKSKIVKLAQGTQNGLNASPRTSAEINKLCDILKPSPQRKPALSSALNGRWELLYTTTTGNSAGKLGPLVGKVYQEIDLQSLRYLNILELGPIVAKLDATWEILAPDQWKVIFRSLQFSILGFSFPEKDLSATGIWRMTYLDDDFRILYAKGVSQRQGRTSPDLRSDDKQLRSGKENNDNVYILRRTP